MTGLFETYGVDDVRHLLERHPLAWVQGTSADGDPQASLLPLVGEYAQDGRLVALIGHLARRNPLHEALQRDPRAVILFNGPQGYVSPEHAGIRNWAPTWNYAQLRVTAQVQFDDAMTAPALDVLIAAMEQGRPQPWSTAEMGPRYGVLAEAIIGFRAEVQSSAAIFKLGQDERPDVLAHILATHPDPDLVAWMRRFNADRP